MAVRLLLLALLCETLTPGSPWSRWSRCDDAPEGILPVRKNIFDGGCGHSCFLHLVRHEPLRGEVVPQIVRQGAVERRDRFLQLLDGPDADEDAADSRMAERELQRCGGEREVVPLARLGQAQGTVDEVRRGRSV